MTSFLPSTHALMAAISLAASVVFTLLQPTDAHRPSLGSVQNPINQHGVDIKGPINSLVQWLDFKNSLAYLALDSSKEATLLLVTCNRVVFTTSTIQIGDFGGLAQGASICKGLAQAANLRSIYLVWLSLTGASAFSPATRFARSVLRQVRTDGVLVDNEFADLTDGSIISSINRDDAQNAGAPALPWTGTTAGGGSDNSNCTHRTSQGMDSNNLANYWRVGAKTQVNAAWTQAGEGLCGMASLRLYRFQQQQPTEAGPWPAPPRRIT